MTFETKVSKQNNLRNNAKMIELSKKLIKEFCKENKLDERDVEIILKHSPFKSFLEDSLKVF